MVWIFGYGSLIWRPDFVFEESAPARLEGWKRRLWQGSPDHRGVPGRPGRVVTLARDVGGSVLGRAYRIESSRRTTVFQDLDLRECAGYQLHSVPLALGDGRSVEGLVYVAGPDNPNFLGPASIEVMSHQILSSSGVSGRNVDYVLSLAKSLDELGGCCEDELSRVVEALDANGGESPRGRPPD